MEQKRGAGFAVGDADAYRGRRPPQIARPPQTLPPLSRPPGRSTPAYDETGTALPPTDDELIDEGIDDELITLVLLDDLLEALGVKVDASGGYEGIQQAIWEAAETKIRHLTGVES